MAAAAPRPGAPGGGARPVPFPGCRFPVPGASSRRGSVPCRPCRRRGWKWLRCLPLAAFARAQRSALPPPLQPQSPGGAPGKAERRGGQVELRGGLCCCGSARGFPALPRGELPPARPGVAPLGGVNPDSHQRSASWHPGPGSPSLPQPPSIPTVPRELCCSPPLRQLPEPPRSLPTCSQTPQIPAPPRFRGTQQRDGCQQKCERLKGGPAGAPGPPPPRGPGAAESLFQNQRDWLDGAG